MTQISNRKQLTVRQAARRRMAIDRELNPTLFRALSDPTRLKLVACLVKCGQWCSVSEVAECCSVDLSVVSRHLTQLAQAGVLESQKAGRTVSYRVRFADLSASMRALADAIDSCCPNDDACRSSCCGSR